jgi:type II secretory pathway component PulL
MIGMLEKVLQKAGLDYTARVHLKRTLQSTQWLFWFAVMALIAAVLAIVVLASSNALPDVK